MRMGSYTGSGFLIFFLLFIPVCGYAFIPVILAEAVIPRVVSRIVLNRAATVAANDAAYLSLVSNTNRALSVAATNAAKTIPKSSVLKNVSNGATWAGIAYSLSDFDIKSLYPNDVIVADNQHTDDNGNSYVDFDGFKINVKDKVDELNPFIVRSSEVPSYYTTINGTQVFGTFEELAASVFSANEASYCYPYSSTRCSVSKFNYLDGYYNESNNAGRVNFEFERTLDGKAEVVKRNALVWRTKPVDNPDYEQDYSKLFQSLEKTNINIDQLANMINSLFMQASTKPDYSGVPFSTSNRVTPDEIRSAYPAINAVTQYEWLSSAQAKDNEQVNFGPKAESPTNIEVTVDLGENPNINVPEMETPPTGEEILQPITELMPDIKNLSISSKDVLCPVWSFELWGNKYSIDSHCELLEKIRPLLKAVFLLIWGIISLRIILTA